MGRVGERPGEDAPRKQDISQNKGHELQAGRLPGTKAKTDSPRHTLLSSPGTLGTRRSYKLPGRKHRSDSKGQLSEWLQTPQRQYWTPGDDGRKPTDSKGQQFPTQTAKLKTRSRTNVSKDFQTCSVSRSYLHKRFTGTDRRRNSTTTATGRGRHRIRERRDPTHQQDRG